MPGTPVRQPGVPTHPHPHLAELTFHAANTSLKALEASLGNSYKCNAEQQVRVTETFSLNMYRVWLQAFRIEDGKFGSGESPHSGTRVCTRGLLSGCCLESPGFQGSPQISGWGRRGRGGRHLGTASDHQSPAAEECQLDENSMLIPIAVGGALAGLVLIVLIAYLIGRKRSHAGYQTI